MALTFPLSVAQFQSGLRISVAEFYQSQPRQIDRMANGQQLTASLGDTIWRGSFVIPPTNDRSVAAGRDALLSVLDRPGSSFLVYDPAKTHPAADPDGTILGAATPTILSLDATDARLIGIEGLPAGYVLTSGDYIGWQYASDPVRYALHRVVSDVTADGAGEIAEVELTPFVQPGVTTGTALVLIKPPIKAVLEPAPDYGSHRAVVSSGARFGFVQTVR
jgi:hypothetical protein